MQQEELLKEAAAQDVGQLEARWMQLLEADDLEPAQLASYNTVLAQLAKTAHNELAETLAWAAIEAVLAQHGPAEALSVAGPFLLAIGESQDLRREATELYRKVYADVQGLEELLTESGLPGGRPVRRALRTLDVCLAVDEGDYLAARDAPQAARIEQVDRAAWRYQITTGTDTETLGAVHLADQYAPAPSDDFRVLRQFAPDTLVDQLNREPADMVVAICQMHENKIDSDQLERFLVPHLIPERDWKKWWTKARNALKHNPNVRLEGRSPYDITYLDDAVHFEDRMRREFDATRDAHAQWAIVDRYLRDCKSRSEAPSAKTLRHCYDIVLQRGQKLAKQGSPRAGLLFAIARRIGEAAGAEHPEKHLVDFLQNANDVPAVLRPIEDDALLEVACDTLVDARTDDWQELYIQLLPELPITLVDRAVNRLLDAGRPLADLQEVIQTAMGAPASHCEVLLWLWDGPSKPEIAADIAPVTLLSRIVRGLQDARIGHDVDKDLAKRITGRAKTVLSARNYENFDRCLEQIDAPMANALRTQIAKLDSLGRVVKEDLVNRLRALAPLQEPKRKAAPWEEQDRLYVTERGLSKKQTEIDHHVNVKMKENARAIGAAAEHGDLSENSEYKFALEERDLLRAKLQQMNAEMAAAVVITPEEVPTDHIGIGTRAVFRRVDDGQRYEVALLGPWDADHSRGSLSYKSPLGQRLMGKRIGDVVDFTHADIVGQFELIELHNALEPTADAQT